MFTLNRRTFLGHSLATAGFATLPPLTFAQQSVDLSDGIDPARELVLNERPADDVRDAVNVWIESDNSDLAMRVGVEALGREWDDHDLWLDIAYPDGRVLNFRGTGDRRPALDDNGQPTIRAAGPIRFQCVEPFKRWTVSFQGDTAETTAMNLARGHIPETPVQVPVQFHVEMIMGAPPWISGSLLPESRAMMDGDQGSFISPRYEQLFHAKGWIEVEGRRESFTGKGLRIRRQGVREFKGFWGHCWQSALFPSGKGFGFNTFPPRDDGKPSFNEGFIFDGSERIPARAVDIPWLRKLQTSGDDVSFTLETMDGRRVSVSGETFINTRSIVKGQTKVPPDFPIVQQAHARYQWDGEETVGMVERSSRPALITFPD